MTLLIAHGGLSAVQLKPLLDEHFGGPFKLSVGAIDAILVRLRERGLIGPRTGSPGCGQSTSNADALYGREPRITG